MPPYELEPTTLLFFPVLHGEDAMHISSRVLCGFALSMTTGFALAVDCQPGSKEPVIEHQTSANHFAGHKLGASPHIALLGLFLKWQDTKTQISNLNADISFDGAPGNAGIFDNSCGNKTLNAPFDYCIMHYKWQPLNELQLESGRKYAGTVKVWYDLTGACVGHQEKSFPFALLVQMPDLDVSAVAPTGSVAAKEGETKKVMITFRVNKPIANYKGIQFMSYVQNTNEEFTKGDTFEFVSNDLKRAGIGMAPDFRNWVGPLVKGYEQKVTLIWKAPKTLPSNTYLTNYTAYFPFNSKACEELTGICQPLIKSGFSLDLQVKKADKIKVKPGLIDVDKLHMH